MYHLTDWGVTKTQRKVLSYIVKGESNDTIGRRLKMSNKTVSTHKINGLKNFPTVNTIFRL
ncbi:LuxR C-terminal-related transcriptional regulator [Morganella morganii]|uniref:LuxR C-terminal-related transcriptional regulator n=1 Tax=Morganella morganii TaxID=582 RepID=UPI0034E2841D